MKRKILGWFAIVTSVIIIILGTLDIIIFNDFRFAIGIPIGIYMIIRFLPDVREASKQNKKEAHNDKRGT